MIDRSDVGVGVFSNIVNVSMTPREVFLDFGMIAPPTSVLGGEGEVTLVGRVVLTKEHAMELRDVLARTLEQAK
jgi:hypothetical protein